MRSIVSFHHYPRLRYAKFLLPLTSTKKPYNTHLMIVDPLIKYMPQKLFKGHVVQTGFSRLILTFFVRFKQHVFDRYFKETPNG